MSNDDHLLPVIQNPADEEKLPSCSPKIYVSNEEAALLAGMRQLREQSAEIKKDLSGADSDLRPRLEAELARMRTEWKDLAAQREKAFVRKMIMLGHLPPGADVESG